MLSAVLGTLEYNISRPCYVPTQVILEKMKNRNLFLLTDNLQYKMQNRTVCNEYIMKGETNVVGL